ncbi:septum formation family protein [Micromonospora krabiensis]|uniref:Septum formation n=1 Tax=Micromonospora krabiensis TaxID=307121 RepID=A0A1C3N211_9ACTN|nr:septum formation family protein [Micromonospora krabiensis]SBV26591.1 Septum formation [Micromonospora krabiensis]
MRRWWTAVVVGATAVLGLGACAPAGLDADLTDDWPAPVAAKTFVPAAGVCHLAVQDVGYLTGYDPVDCAESHRVETLHVGTLSGAAAAQPAPPTVGSAGIRAARAECDREANKAVGGEWRTGRLAVDVVFPSPAAWTGGARWFRCDAGEVRGLDDGVVNPRTGSLRGALKGDAPLAHRCFNPTLEKDAIKEMVPASCTARHHAEFVGVYQAPDISFAAFTRATLDTHKACRKLLAGYAKVPNDGNLQYRAGTIFYHPFEQEWRNGNRGVQCFLWVSDRNLTRSMKGAGSKGLPVT